MGILIVHRISFIMLNRHILNLIVIYSHRYQEYKLIEFKHYYNYKIKIMTMQKI
jgi:hypothetical protein